MAATTKKVTTNATKKAEIQKESNIPTVDLIQENETLKKQMESMQAQMELLIKQMALANTSSTPKTKKAERNIEIINLVPGTLVLKGSQIWKIEGQFNSRLFLESEARLIVNNMQNTARSGLMYIPDDEFIKDCELESAYTTLLSNQQLQELLSKKFDEVVAIYKTVPKAQQEIIVSMIKEKKAAGVHIDANILIEIGELCGQDLVRGVEYEDGE